MAVLGLDTEATIQRDLPRLIGAAVGIVAVYRCCTFARSRWRCWRCCQRFSARVSDGRGQGAGAKLNLANIVAIRC